MSSVRGTSHEIADQPNQDALFVEPAQAWQPQTTPFTIAIADGHGGFPHFRSEHGSRFAVKSACRVLLEYVKSGQSTAASKDSVQHLKRMIVGEWLKDVNAHVANSPFSPAELNALRGKSSSEFATGVEEHPEIAYGSTLIALAVTEASVVVVQLGDGDVLACLADGSIKRLFPETAHAENDSWVETDSLANPEAWKDIYVSVINTEQHDFSLILLSTDGLRKGYASELGFHQVIPDLVKAFREEGFTELDVSLPRLLRVASREGGGDDVTAVFAIKALSIRSPWTPRLPVTDSETRLENEHAGINSAGA